MGIKRSIKNYFKNKKLIKSMEIDFPITEPKIISSIEKIKLCFESSLTPKVSIIIPYFNEENYTWNCLKYLHKNLKSNIPFEIILIDDNSTENCDFSLVKGISIIKNTTNLGFLKNINKGISIAKGEYIYLLNNDTEVQENFLEELFFVFENFKNVGAVGSLLYNSNNTLQESGSLFLKDCEITQISHKPIYYPEINYTRKVDYCSGCSLLFKKINQNGEVNSFDEQFAPAYFEETDLCFQFKYIQNKDIYYTPFSKVLHYNGVSYNSSQNDDVKILRKKELFDINLDKFKFKWKSQIDNIKANNIEDRIFEIYSNKSIVFFVEQIPSPDKDSGSNRLYEIILAYRDLGFHVTLLTKKVYYNSDYVSFFQRIGINVFYIHKQKRGIEHYIEKNKITSLIVWFYNPIVFNEYYNLAKQIFPNAKFVFDMVDIHHLRLKRAYEIEPQNDSLLNEYKKLKEIELAAVKLADFVIPVSDFDLNYMKQFCSESKLVLISNIHYPKIEIEKTLPFEDRKDILFIGSQHTPNIDALYFLFNEIMPLVWKELPEIKVNIIGNVNETVKDIHHPNFIFHGFVHDITDFFISNKMNIAPLRYGAGVKGKIGQSFEYYLPVATTSIGAEGMKLINNENALIDDSPVGFASNIIKLYSDKNLWLHLQKNSENSLLPFSRENLDKIINMKF